MKFNIERSSQIDERNMKLMFWGESGTRKTETVLRNFPRVLTIDSEYNTDLCADVPEVPEFMRYQTKDLRQIKEIIEEIKLGNIKFFDGKPVETFCIDSVTVLWAVQQEIGMLMAEKRAVRYNRDIATANMTMSDWGIVKRPMKEMINSLNGTGIKYVVSIARSKDLYKENEKGESEKVGLVEDTVKGMKFDMNLSLQFGFSPKSGKWFYYVDKVQGGLNTIFPDKSYGDQFPFEALEEYASRKRASTTVGKSDTDIAEEILEDEKEASGKDKSGLVKLAEEKGFTKDDVLPILKKHGIEKYDQTKWDDMAAAIRAEANGNGHH